MIELKLNGNIVATELDENLVLRDGKVRKWLSEVRQNPIIPYTNRSEIYAKRVIGEYKDIVFDEIVLVGIIPE